MVLPDLFSSDGELRVHSARATQETKPLGPVPIIIKTQEVVAAIHPTTLHCTAR